MTINMPHLLMAIGKNNSVRYFNNASVLNII